MQINWFIVIVFHFNYGICDVITFNENSIHTGIPALCLTNSSVLKIIYLQKIRIFSYCEINILHNALVINKGQVFRERSIQKRLLQSCTWRVSLACCGRQYDSGDRVVRNGERREKAEERKMIEELPCPPPAFFLHTFLRAVPTILEQTGFISFRWSDDK